VYLKNEVILSLLIAVVLTALVLASVDVLLVAVCGASWRSVPLCTDAFTGLYITVE
jgi:hypothetical protein